MKKWKVIQNHRKGTVMKQVKVNNYLFMDNQERFENVFFGYAIQCDRVMALVNKISEEYAQTGQATEKQKGIVDRCVLLLNEIKTRSEQMTNLYTRYKKHIMYSAYCQKVLKPYVSKLEKIIARVDALVESVEG